jgi:tetratricopeptide (TPR) repeat protein
MNDALRAAVGLLAAGLLTVSSVDAAAGGPEDWLGTAGSFRSVGGAQCASQGFPQGNDKVCDLSPVKPGLSPSKRSRALVERAIKLLAHVQMDEAKESVEEALKADPRNLAALKLRARLSLTMGASSAAAEINDALFLAPKDSDLLATRAELSLGSNTEAALRDANAAVRENRDNADARWIRARIFMGLKLFGPALEDLSHALQIVPGYHRARSFRAIVYMHIDRPKEAIEDATLVLADRPSDLTALQLRAQARMAVNDLTGAVEDLSQVLGEPGSPLPANPSHAMFHDLYAQRVSSLLRLGREREAMLDFDTMTRLGGPPAISRMQIYLRKHRAADIRVDGKRSEAFDEAAKLCFVDEKCGRALWQTN